MSGTAEAQIERFAPGFSRRILARHVTTAPALEAFSPVFRGGDVNGGAGTLWGLLARPYLGLTPTAHRYEAGICAAAAHLQAAVFMVWPGITRP
ncbi:hypothetical protein ACFSC4_00880 [Deinococcus malanensis]|uniref:hypothetical protein n=1 Tax=Deinococcus malanensis TaxID=1706855 RepID=UPI0036368103